MLDARPRTPTLVRRAPDRSEAPMPPRVARLGALETPRLLVVTDRSAELATLADALRAEDLLVVNDAATLPASLPVMIFGALPGELRLTCAPTRTCAGTARLTAIVLGAGTYRTPTEHRPPPPRVLRGSKVKFHTITLEVTDVHDSGGRQVTLETTDTFEHFVAALYRHGQVIQYAYVPERLHLWDTQTPFARVPLAVEAPSATYLLPRSLPCDVVSLTHAAGISDTGDAELNGFLPFPERFDVPDRTVQAIERTKARGGRVVAVGTSVTRALETSARRVPADAGHLLSSGAGTSSLRIDGNTKRLVVDGIVTGVHEAHTSHRSLLSAFLPPVALGAAYERSTALGLHTHEFGDGWLILPPS